MADKDNPDTTLKNLGDADVPEELRELGPQRVSERDLVRWLSEQLQAHPGCGAVTVDRLFRLDAPDSEGCNWSRTLVLDPRNVSPDVYAVPYAAVVEKARKLFALE